jgi:hypothetical protein
MKTKMTFLISVVLLLAGSIPAATYYVNWDGSADFTEIQPAIDAADYGDTIYVAGGTYVENISLKNGVALIGAGASTTTIDGNDSGSVVTSSGCDYNTVLQGFTITNGYNDSSGGAGMYNQGSSPTVMNCTFSSNTVFSSVLTVRGGGMYNDVDSNPTVTNCIFSNNNADRGGGMCNGVHSNPTVTNCYFYENVANYGGAMDDYDIGIPLGTTTVTNCTFCGNYASYGPGIYSMNSALTVTNCIFGYSSPPDISGSGEILCTYSNVRGDTGVFPGEGNINADPMFVDYGRDIHLQSGSPCIDAGNNAAVPAGITTDMDGIARFIDDPDTADTGSGTPPIVDMGAYEYFDNDAPVADAGGPYTVNQSQPLLLDASASTPGVDDTTYGDSVVSYEWDLENDGAFDDHITTDTVTTIPWDILSTLSRPVGQSPPISLRVTDKIGLTDTASTTLTITYEPLYWPQHETQKLLASDGEATDFFGYSVAIKEDTAIVGAFGDDDNGSFSGASYIFRFDGSNWIEEAKLLASDGAATDFFGYSVAIEEDSVIIGAYGDESYTGAAYIFRFDGSNWTQEQKLLASDGAASDNFGRSVSVSGDTVIVGAECENDKGDDSGSAYIFRYNGSSWGEEAKLTASDGATGDGFGFSVVIKEDTAIVGAYGDESYTGAAYVFRFDGSNWIQEQKLLASDGAVYDRFGYSLAIDDNTAVVGAYLDDDNGGGSGAAYVFRFDGSNWIQEAKLTADDGAANDYFGHSVAIDNDTVINGAWGDDDNGNASGSAYVFSRDGSDWNQEAKLTASDGEAVDHFGYHSVTISEDTVIIGARYDDDNGSDSGSAYIFEPVPCPEADLTGDCFVDLEDVAVVASQWLSGKQ